MAIPQNSKLRLPCCAMLLTFAMVMWGTIASAGAVPRDEQMFCDAFPDFQRALEGARGDSNAGSIRNPREFKRVAKRAATDFRRKAGWRGSSESVQGWTGEVRSLVESTVWGHYAAPSVKLPCGDVVVGVPESYARRWTATHADAIAQSCMPADPYVNWGAPLYSDLNKLRVGQSVVFSGSFCTIPDSVGDDGVYFVFSKIRPER